VGHPVYRVPTVTLGATSGEVTNPQMGLLSHHPHVAIMNFYLSSYLSRSLKAQGPKKISLKNILLIMAPREALLEV
jgi:hypothetical protein